MKKKLFENVNGNQFRLAKENNPEAWRGHEAPFEADPPESGEAEGIWATIRDAKDDLTDYENGLKAAQASNNEDKFWDIYEKVQEFADQLGPLFNGPDSSANVRDPVAKKKIDDIWERLNNILK